MYEFSTRCSARSTDINCRFLNSSKPLFTVSQQNAGSCINPGGRQFSVIVEISVPPRQSVANTPSVADTLSTIEMLIAVVNSSACCRKATAYPKARSRKREAFAPKAFVKATESLLFVHKAKPQASKTL